MDDMEACVCSIIFLDHRRIESLKRSCAFISGGSNLSFLLHGGLGLNFHKFACVSSFLTLSDLEAPSVFGFRGREIRNNGILAGVTPFQFVTAQRVHVYDGWRVHWVGIPV